MVYRSRRREDAAVRRLARTWAAVGLAMAGVMVVGCEDDRADAAPVADSEAVARAERANAVMVATTFHATGTTTAVSNAIVETRYDPAHGLHAVVKRDFEKIGETICRDGVAAVSRSLLGGGGNPAYATDYVVTRLPGGCVQLFTIPISDQAPLQPGEDRVVDGAQTQGVTVASDDETAAFWIAADGQPYILRQESKRGHLNGHTDYGEFGRPVTIPPLPPH